MNHKNFNRKPAVLRVTGALFASAIVLTACAANDTPNASTDSTVVHVDPATGATSPAETTPVAPGSDAAATELINAVTVTGPLGSEPEVVFEMPLEVTTPVTRLVSDGDGEQLRAGQLVSVDASMWRTDTGEKIVSTWDDNYPESFILGSQQWALLSSLLEGQHVGARVLIANSTTLGAGESATVLTIFEVVNTRDVPTRATGEAVDYDADALGVLVTLADNGEPSIQVADGFTPADELVVQTLIEGDGPVVTPDQTLMVHYTGWLVNGDVFDSSWTRNEAATFPLSGVIPGWTEGLAGQHVGSQVLLIIPPELAYGDSEVGTIPANSTLIFVVDILNAE